MEDCTRLDIINASNLERKNLTKKLAKTRVSKSDTWKKELKSILSESWNESSNGIDLQLEQKSLKQKYLSIKTIKQICMDILLVVIPHDVERVLVQLILPKL